VRGTDRNRTIDALLDQEVEQVQAGYRCDQSDVEPFRPAGPRDADDPAGGRSLQGEGHHDDVLQPATCKGQKCDRGRDLSVLTGSRLGPRPMRSMAARKGSGSAGHALRMERAVRRPGAGRGRRRAAGRERR
jgi:hypothetical protein